MTDICGGGTSGPKPGVAESLIFTTGALASLLNNRGGAWATLAAPLLGVLSYEASELCSTDPPDPADLTAEEWTALLQLSPWETMQSGLAKLADKVKALIWYEFCQCTSVSTPARPADVLQPPPNAAQQPLTVGPCITRSLDRPILNQPVGTSVYQSGAIVSPGLFPELTTVSTNFSGLTVTHNAPQWATPTPSSIFAKATLTNPGTPGPGFGGAYTFNISSAAAVPGAAFTVINLIMTASSPIAQSTGYVAWPSTRPTILAILATTDCAGAEALIEVQINCAGSVVGGNNPCQADPQILMMLGQIMQLLTVTQRQGIPFATVDGPEHTGLSGDGSIDVQGLIGAVVTVTAYPDWVGLESGDPDVVFNAGWVNWSAGGRFTPRQFINCSPMVSTPVYGAIYDSLHYSIPEGVEITIRELHREA